MVDKNILHLGFKFLNSENGKKKIRPIQLDPKTGDYGFFGDSSLNIEEPMPLNSDNGIIQSGDYNYHYVDKCEYKNKIIYRVMPWTIKKYKWYIRLKATVQYYLRIINND